MNPLFGLDNPHSRKGFAQDSADLRDCKMQKVGSLFTSPCGIQHNASQPIVQPSNSSMFAHDGLPSFYNLLAHHSAEFSSINSGAAFKPQKQPSQLSHYINPCAANGKGQEALEAHFDKNYVPSFADTYKTVMCQTWLESATCRFGSRCRFAHGEEELRHTNVKPRLAGNRLYKTRPCKKFVENGICPYGPRCLFIHPEVPSQSYADVCTGDNKNEKLGSAYSLRVPPKTALNDFDIWTMPAFDQRGYAGIAPYPTVWSSDECEGSDPTTTTDSPPDYYPFLHLEKKEAVQFNDSSDCLKELSEKLACALETDMTKAAR